MAQRSGDPVSGSLGSHHQRGLSPCCLPAPSPPLLPDPRGCGSWPRSPSRARAPTQPHSPPLSHLFQIMALAFIFALLAQRVPCVGDELDAITLLRMQEREAYLTEKMTQLLLEIEQKNMAQSRMGLQALLFAALPYWKICSVLCLFILLFWFMWKIQKEFRGPDDSSDEESSSSEEQEQEEEQQEQVLVLDDTLFLADVLWPIGNHKDSCKEMLSLLEHLINISQTILSDTFFPMPEYPTGVGSTYEGWCPPRDEPVFCLLVPLTAPRGHVFHLELGTAGELPARNSRVRVVLECVCGREQEMGMLCFLHASEDELRNQQPSLLHSLCTGSYLDVEKTACWFTMLIRNAWKCIPAAATCSMKAMLPRRSCRLHLTDYLRRTYIVEIVFGVQQDNTDIFLSSQETEAAITASTTWPQSCAMAEVKFFQHIDAHSQGENFYHRYLQVYGYILVGYNFSTYELKTVLMHLLTAIPLENWHGRYFFQRMDDIMRYLRCCLEEKRLNHFLIGNEEVPAEIILPQDFQVSEPLNLFQHLAQDPDKHEQALHELEDLEDRLASLLIYGK
ncbi:inositol 1,4,5-trisphosphate receptor-interacting protein-like 1 [Numida meleagris]|uniref:inositol 1,4,5-trisphosphate receptor-interacting protein-like 1 n=1 Tax=Numida meleagris TaxID=8996 RepID=UPI000B3DE620|nr:inositol 1,4,5-trisphosphate receptor-interacting protein-like 1 [Numida meleagris]